MEDDLMLTFDSSRLRGDREFERAENDGWEPRYL